LQTAPGHLALIGKTLSAILSLSRDVAAINAAVNHPAVRPFVGPGDDYADLTSIVERPENLFPLGDFGGFSFVWTAPRCREVHTFILPEGRGAWARQAAREGIALARENGTRTLWTRVPPDGPHVRAYAVGMGMSPTGEAIDTFGQPWEILSMDCETCQ